MERVKPLYLSRTYNVPLPDKDNPTQGWEPDVFLDKLARMKGRLLKHGEPDLESVAKIMLSDWVRGRIPYFAPPPERPEGLNEMEAKKRAKDAKGKGKATEKEDKAELPRVKQNLGSIMQKNTFLGEDVQPLDEEDVEEDAEAQSEGADREEGEEEEEEREEEELTWDDVWDGIKPEDQESGPSGKGKITSHTDSSLIPFRITIRVGSGLR